MKTGSLIKIKNAKQFILHREDYFKDKLAIWLKKTNLDGKEWHLVHMCHNNKREAVYQIKMEVINESKCNET
jgi:hypothetical protein